MVQLYVTFNFVDGTQADSYIVRNQAISLALGSRCWSALVLSWILIALAVVMKNNMIVFWIAMAIVALFAVWQRQVKWSLAVEWLFGSLAVLMLSMSLMSGIATRNGYQKSPD